MAEQPKGSRRPTEADRQVAAVLLPLLAPATVDVAAALFTVADIHRGAVLNEVVGLLRRCELPEAALAVQLHMLKTVPPEHQPPSPEGEG